MVWGCMTSKGVGYLCRIDAGLEAELYQRILSDELMKTFDWYDMDGEDIVIQHDNDPKAQRLGPNGTGPYTVKRISGAGHCLKEG